MASKLIRLTISTGEELYIRPEVIVAFCKGHGFPSSSSIRLWGTDDTIYIRETPEEIAALLT